MNTSIGLLTLRLRLPGSSSLKEKRSRIKPLLARLHKEFNISVAEIDQNDLWKEATIACAIVSNDHTQNRRMMQRIVSWVEGNWPDVLVAEESIEII